MDEREDDRVREVGEDVGHSSCRPAESKKNGGRALVQAGR